MADINLSGSISTTGTSILGHSSVVFASDANHTLSVSEYTNNFLSVTSGVSLTATRNLIAPLVIGQGFVVQNNTTGGQAIQIIGSSGTGVVVLSGTTALVVCDGTNYLSITTASGSTIGPLSPPANGSWAQATWFIDPQNITATASDSNNGLTSGTALLTYKELARRWGTLSPVLPQVTTITFLSSHTSGSDPVIATPILILGGTLIIQGTRTQVATGTLSGVAAKNRATPQLLNATLAAGLAAKQIIVNTTRGNSEARLYKVVSGTTWAISQPLTQFVVPDTLTITEVDTWANGDTYFVYSINSVDLVKFLPLIADFDGLLDNSPVAQNLNVLDPSGLKLEGCIIGHSVQVANVSMDRTITLENTPDTQLGPIMSNCTFSGGAYTPGGRNNGPSFLGGILLSGTFSLQYSLIEFDIILASATNFVGGGSYALAYIETGITLGAISCTISNDHLTDGKCILWGPGSVNVSFGSQLFYSQFSSASTTFQFTGGITLDGGTKAYSINGITLNSNVSITAANLDAPAGPSGFGGNAFLFSGSLISNAKNAQINALTQATWFIDPSLGFDGYTGLSATFTSGTTGPIKTWAELVRRWGTNTPLLRQDTTITFVSGHTDGTDPVIFNPIIANQASIVLTGQLGASQQVATGTLSGVVSKNRATPQLLNATLAAGLAAGQLIINSTHSSRAWLYKVVSGTTWAISQPFAPRSITNFSIQPAEVDTWTNGDTYTVYNPVAVNIVSLSPILADVNATTFANLLQIYQIKFFDPTPGLNTMTFETATWVVTECTIVKAIRFEFADYPLTNGFTNCDVEYMVGAAGVANGIYFNGGQIRSLVLTSGLRFDGDTIIGFTTTFSTSTYGTLYLDTGVTANISCGMQNRVLGLSSYNSGVPVIWGPGILNVIGNANFTYPSSQTAVTVFKNTGGLKINGLTVANAYNPAGIGTFVSGISITAANLDAAISAGGFGGTAIVPGAGSITNSTTPTAFSTLSFTSTLTNPIIKQADLTTNGGTGTSLTIQAQNETGTTSIGGPLNLTSGTGTSTAGNVNIQTGGVTEISVSPTTVAITPTLISTVENGPTVSGTVSAYNNASFIIFGTITVNNGSPNVSGSGTKFTVDLVTGQNIQFVSQLGVTYTVQSITNDGALVLTGNYTGTNSSTTSINYTVGGTVSVNNSSPTVTGTGTAFTKDLSVGQLIQFGSQTSYYVIDSIASDTSLTLVRNYTGTTNASTTIIQYMNIVRGSGTTFTSQLVSGMAINIGNDAIYIISRIISDTKLSLSRVYVGLSTNTAVVQIHPNIFRIKRSSDVQSESIVVHGQDGYKNAATNITGGNIVLNPGVGSDQSSGSILIPISNTAGASFTTPSALGQDSALTIYDANSINVAGSASNFWSVQLNTSGGARTYWGPGTFIDAVGSGGANLNFGTTLGGFVFNPTGLPALTIGSAAVSIFVSTFDWINNIISPLVKQDAMTSDGYVQALTVMAQSVPTKVLSGTFNTQNGSPSVTTTTDQTAVVGPSSTIVFGNQPNTVYYVSTVTSGTITLTANFTGTTNTTNTAATSTVTVLTGTFNTQNGSSSVATTINHSGSGTNAIISAISYITFGNQPGIFYLVTNVTINTLTLASNFTGTTNTTNTGVTIVGTALTGGTAIVQGGAAAINGSIGNRGGVKLQLGGSSSQTFIEIAEIGGTITSAGSRVIALSQLGSGITTTQMPINTGDGVIWIGNAQTNPTAAPVGGAILYASAGKLNIYQSDGTSFTINSSASTFTAGGDLTGTATSQQVIALTGTAGTVASAANTINFTGGTGNLQSSGVTIAQVNANKLWAEKGWRQNVTAVSTTPYAVLATDNIIATDSTSTAITVNMPASPSIGDTYQIKDSTGQAGSNPITINGNGHNIDGSSSATISVAYGSFTLAFTGSVWSVL